MSDTRGCRLVAAERLRQIQAEGWSADHDDEHEDGTIVDAAICYAQATNPDQYGGGNPPPGWPWLAKYWKPGRPIRMLVKAAALLVADIDRRLRAGEGRDIDDAPDPIAALTAERDAALAERDALRVQVEKAERAQESIILARLNLEEAHRAAQSERDALRAEVAVLRATGRVTADDATIAAMTDPNSKQWEAVRAIVSRAVRDGVPLTLAWHPDAVSDPDALGGDGWAVQLADRSRFGRLMQAIERHGPREVAP